MGVSKTIGELSIINIGKLTVVGGGLTIKEGQIQLSGFPIPQGHAVLNIRSNSNGKISTMYISNTGNLIYSGIPENLSVGDYCNINGAYISL